MNRTIKEATVKRFHYDDHQQFKTHLAQCAKQFNERSAGLLNRP